MNSKAWKWALGLFYIFLVATIWIAASFVVQSVVDGGVSPFLITYICNSLFVVYLPIAEIGRYLEDSFGGFLFWQSESTEHSRELGELEQAVLLRENDSGAKSDGLSILDAGEDDPAEGVGSPGQESYELESGLPVQFTVAEDANKGLDSKGRWTRTRVAKVSLLVCPFWFLAQLTFNLSLKYTTVTSNTILSSTSSLFTFLVSLVFLGEGFTWVKLVSVLLCMTGTIVVSLGGTKSASSAISPNPLLGNFLALVSAAMYSIYITLIRLKLPADDGKSGKASIAQFLGFLGLFNLFIFLPVALVLNVAHLEPFNTLTWNQLGLIVAKGLLDNVLSDYLWAKAVVLTTTTVATAGLTIQVPLAAIVDTLTGNAPPLMDYIGAAAVMIGFAGINIPSGAFRGSKESNIELEQQRRSG